MRCGPSSCSTSRSPFTYLAAERVDRAFDAVTWTPACARTLRCRALPANDDEAEPIMELAEERAAALRLPLEWPERWPMPVPAAMRVAHYAAQRGPRRRVRAGRDPARVRGRVRPRRPRDPDRGRGRRRACGSTRACARRARSAATARSRPPRGACSARAPTGCPALWSDARRVLGRGSRRRRGRDRAPARRRGCASCRPTGETSPARICESSDSRGSPAPRGRGALRIGSSRSASREQQVEVGVGDRCVFGSAMVASFPSLARRS